MNKLLHCIILCIALSISSCSPSGPDQTKAYTRWWWMGSAVDKDNISRSLDELQDAGISGVEITPIYGVQDNEANDIDFLSPEWMEMYSYTVKEAAKRNIQVDLNTGTGWPFGGPEVTLEEAATHYWLKEYRVKGQCAIDITLDIENQKGIAYLDKLMAYSNGAVRDITDKVVSDRLEWTAPDNNEWQLIALFVGKSLQEVNRAAPGGEGLVMDHYNPIAVRHYLDKFDKAFAESGAPFPDTFFNDSYEVYDAEWTPGMLEEFEKRRGYKLQDYLPEFLDCGEGRSEISSRVISDYRETLSDMLKENFTQQWTDWAHSHGVRTRNQAHGSPGNLIDLYGIVDIPECEGFGLSDFGIKGLRKDDPYTKKNDSDLSMLKYASSAAHISGKPLTSSETFTWLTEHFRTSFSQCKADLDLMFVSGVNHVYFHGTCYSPEGDPWPGWKFYATIDMSPTNPQWNAINDFDTYIERCQKCLQDGMPDNDFLLYLPIYDIWHKQPDRYLAFEIHRMDVRAPEFIEVVNSIEKCGFDVDYISDDFIRGTNVIDGELETSGGSHYQAIVLPSVTIIPTDVLAHLLELADQGADLIFTGCYPATVPGLGNLATRQIEFDKVAAALPPASFEETEIHSYGQGRIITGSDYSSTLSASGVKEEKLKTDAGLNCIRRKTDNGKIYFVSALNPNGFEGWVDIDNNGHVMIFDPMSGRKGMAAVSSDGKQVRLQLQSGESIIIRTDETCRKQWEYIEPAGEKVFPSDGWELSFVNSEPEVTGHWHLDKLQSWTELGDSILKINCGTALYRSEFEVTEKADEWVLHLGDVRENALVRINGKVCGTYVWAIPFDLKVGDYLRKGTNTIEIEVTNLPANRISDYDRRGVPWRKFKNINTVTIHYKPSDYSGWSPVASGLCSEVYLEKYTIE